MTELDLLRRIADIAARLLARADQDAAAGRLNLAERWPAEVTALSDALYALDELDQAEEEIERVRAKLDRWGEA